MSLRARLALLFTFIVGGILLLFGMAVYVSVRVVLVNQVDTLLTRSANELISQTRAPLLGDVGVIEIPALDLSADIYIQIWTPDRRLAASSLNVRNLPRPLDEGAIQSGQPVFRDVTIERAHLRVLTVPLTISRSRRLIGVMQVGTSLAVVDASQHILLLVLWVGALTSMTVAGLAGWLITRQALAPLGDVTRTALQITRADDLSRRIPYAGPDEDEVGQLIRAFNTTLGRLETLFLSQRRFLADVGHELRTPLTVIKGNVELIRRFGADEESLESIETEVDRLTRLVGDLLLLAQAESGKLPLAHNLVELDSLLLEVLHQMKVLTRNRQQLQLGEFDQVLVCGDADRLKQVLVNLIGNAMQYTPEGGEVTVGLGKVNQQAHLTVSDTGPGIPPEDMPYIFERFYRGEKSRTRSREGKGFGLGLSIAYWIVRNHGGQIEVLGREPHGTTFAIFLPLAQGDCKQENEKESRLK